MIYKSESHKQNMNRGSQVEEESKIQNPWESMFILFSRVPEFSHTIDMTVFQ